MPSFAARKFDDVVRHGQRSRGRGCGEAVLYQVIFGELPFQEGLGLGMSLAANPTRPGSDELPGVRERTLAVKAREQPAPGPLRPCRQKSSAAASEPGKIGPSAS